MPLLNFEVHLQYKVGAAGADFILNIEAARTAYQSVLAECLSFSQSLNVQRYEPSGTQNRFLRFRAGQGYLDVNYEATVALSHDDVAPDTVFEVPVSQLPDQVLPYLYPSRYCQSDRLTQLAMELFGQMPKGYRRIEAIQDWVRANLVFQMKSSNSMTSALETLAQRTGVCRDFAHLMISLCRALSIPARYTTGIDYGADPALGPPDFHAYVEVYLGYRWYLFDPSGVAIKTGLIRIGTGRDAADVSYATIFGDVGSEPPIIYIQASPDSAGSPLISFGALSTDDGRP